MIVTKDDVKKIAKLAHLNVEEKDIAKYQHAFAETLKWIDQLNEVDVQGVRPMRNVISSIRDISSELFDSIQSSYQSDKKLSQQEAEAKITRDDSCSLPLRTDTANTKDGAIERKKILDHAPEEKYGFFTVPKMI